MQGFRLRLFDTPALLQAAGAEPLLPERLTQLAVVLAARDDWTTRDHVVALLWPALDDESARRNLRKLLFRARRQPWFDGLQARTDALRWRADSDLRDFETACGRQDWERAVAAYGGAFCDGLEHKAAEPFVEWLRFERNRLGSIVSYRGGAKTAATRRRCRAARAGCAAMAGARPVGRGRAGRDRRSCHRAGAFRRGTTRDRTVPRAAGARGRRGTVGTRAGSARRRAQRCAIAYACRSGARRVAVRNCARPKHCCCATSAAC